jgi:hypothetical protein
LVAQLENNFGVFYVPIRAAVLTKWGDLIDVFLQMAKTAPTAIAEVHLKINWRPDETPVAVRPDIPLRRPYIRRRQQTEQ